ncbi:hypothetical protein [Actinomadura sp. 6N118]|uniref:hypothetical protein n=1 Tax=Actinomadura sp. 6N118 TaxID=3375151 RepID=UPI0037AF5150
MTTATLTQVKDGLKDRLETIPELNGRIFAYIPGAQEPPSVTIVPGAVSLGNNNPTLAMAYDKTMAGGSHDYVFTLALVVSKTVDRDRVKRPLFEEPPETPDQALYWERVTARYQEHGLCRRCAGQAAYGHRHGFTRVRSACDNCMATVVVGLPLPASNGWRRLQDPWRKAPRTFHRWDHKAGLTALLGKPGPSPSNRHGETRLLDDTKDAA